MQHSYDDLYHDRTWFDALGDWLMLRVRRLMPRSRAQLWTTGFALFASLCVAWAAGLATQAVLFEAAWNQRAAELLAAGLLLIAARHFLAVTGLSARPARKLITRPAEERAPQIRVTAGTPSAAPCRTELKPQTAADGVSAYPGEAAGTQDFFRALREAGINVRIAQALHAAGFRSAAQVRACSDAQLLATPGVGQATLRKLRIRFGLPQAAEAAQSSAA